MYLQGSYEAMYCLLTISDQKYELTLDGSDIGFVSNSAAPIQQAPIVPSTEKGDFLNGIMSLGKKQFSRLDNKIRGCPASELRLWVRRRSWYTLTVSKRILWV